MSCRVATRAIDCIKPAPGLQSPVALFFDRDLAITGVVILLGWLLGLFTYDNRFYDIQVRNRYNLFSHALKPE
jgi:hypothetical protein